MNQTKAVFVVTSCNFPWHDPIEAETFEIALERAKVRCFEARIEYVATGELVAVWSPAFGLKMYDRELTERPRVAAVKYDGHSRHACEEFSLCPQHRAR